eukprot:1351237-Ditylum_brightwellii.AAC.1
MRHPAEAIGTIIGNCPSSSTSDHWRLGKSNTCGMPKSPLPAAPGWVALSGLNLQANLSGIPASAQGGYQQGWQLM